MADLPSDTNMEVTGTWYDHEVRPFGRAVATWLQSEAEPHYGHVLLEVRQSRAEIWWMLTISCR